MRDDPLCDRCKTAIDTLEHKYYSCAQVQKFWKEIESFLAQLGLQIPLSQRTILSGVGSSKLVTHAIILAKSIIQNSQVISIDIFKAKLNNDMTVEKYGAKLNRKLEKFNQKWSLLDRINPI